jgi:hypothetical protein
MTKTQSQSQSRPREWHLFIKKKRFIHEVNLKFKNLLRNELL